MPRPAPFRLAAACALALVLALSLSVPALAKGPLVGLRVVGKGNKTLAETTVGVGGKVAVKASPKATCFGPGTGGSGKSVQMKGATALGALLRVAQFTAALKPVLITDHFDFGLGICGIGGSVSGKSLSWYLKVNHKNPELGGELVKVGAGDKVLWALAGFPYPKELFLVAPSTAYPGQPFQVTVFSYDDKGRRKPAAGATVTGASGPTDASGHATVTLTEGTALSARHGKDIPSNSVSIAMCDAYGGCPVP